MRSRLWCPAEMRFQVPPKTFTLDGRITQRIGQWVSSRRTGDWESPGAKCSATKPRITVFSLRRLAERRCLRPETSETGTQHLARYLGARYRRHRWTVTTSLYCTRRGIAIHRPRSCFWVPVIKLGEGEHTSARSVGKSFCCAPPRFWSYKYNYTVVALVSDFVMVSAVLSVSCLLFFPPCPAISKRGGTCAPMPYWVGTTVCGW